jgi:hypothetical protein
VKLVLEDCYIFFPLINVFTWKNISDDVIPVFSLSFSSQLLSVKVYTEMCLDNANLLLYLFLYTDRALELLQTKCCVILCGLIRPKLQIQFSWDVYTISLSSVSRRAQSARTYFGRRVGFIESRIVLDNFFCTYELFIRLFWGQKTCCCPVKDPKSHSSKNTTVTSLALPHSLCSLTWLLVSLIQFLCRLLTVFSFKFLYTQPLLPITNGPLMYSESLSL